MPQLSIGQSFINFGLKLGKLWRGGGRNPSLPPPPWTERPQKSLDWIGLTLEGMRGGCHVDPPGPLPLFYGDKKRVILPIAKSFLTTAL